MIFSKRQGFLQPRSTGVYGHLPKFWNCRKYDLNYTPRYDESIEFIAKMNEKYEELKDYHAKCRIPWHLSYVGYFVLTLKKSRVVFWYMGNPYRHKLVEFQKQPPIVVERNWPRYQRPKFDSEQV